MYEGWIKIPGGGDKILRDGEETKYKVVLNQGGGEGVRRLPFLLSLNSLQGSAQESRQISPLKLLFNSKYDIFLLTFLRYSSDIYLS